MSLVDSLGGGKNLAAIHHSRLLDIAIAELGNQLRTSGEMRLAIAAIQEGPTSTLVNGTLK